MRTLPATIRLETAFASGTPRVAVDPSQFGSAILNLAINARDAMPDGGTLRITTRNLELRPGDELARDGAGLEPGRYVVLEVADTGVGIPSAALDQVFEPFFTTKGVGEGSGLGLAMVYGFAKQSGGHAEVDSRLGEGTTIRLYFPEGRRAPACAGRTPTRSRLGPKAGSERILVVEDAADVRAAVTAQLAALGYAVQEAATGAAALAALRGGPHFDLMLTDVVMPGELQGPALARDRRGGAPGDARGVHDRLLGRRCAGGRAVAPQADPNARPIADGAPLARRAGPGTAPRRRRPPRNRFRCETAP